MCARLLLDKLVFILNACMHACRLGRGALFNSRALPKMRKNHSKIRQIEKSAYNHINLFEFLRKRMEVSLRQFK